MTAVWKMACGLRDGLCRNLDEKMCTTQNKVEVESTAAQRRLTLCCFELRSLFLFSSLLMLQVAVRL